MSRREMLEKVREMWAEGCISDECEGCPVYSKECDEEELCWACPVWEEEEGEDV